MWKTASAKFGAVFVGTLRMVSTKEVPSKIGLPVVSGYSLECLNHPPDQSRVLRGRHLIVSRVEDEAIPIDISQRPPSRNNDIGNIQPLTLAEPQILRRNILVLAPSPNAVGQVRRTHQVVGRGTVDRGPTQFSQAGIEAPLVELGKIRAAGIVFSQAGDHSDGRSRGTPLRHAGAVSHGGVTQTKWSPPNPARFRQLKRKDDQYGREFPARL